jgi:hypothetical protein
MKASFFLYIFILMLTGCKPFNSASYQIGPQLDDKEMVALQGLSREEVIARYGQPSFQCLHEHHHNLCYFHQNKKHDHIESQRYIEIMFDDVDRVASIQIHDPN